MGPTRHFPCWRSGVGCGKYEEPALRILCIELKYGPWRDALVEAWTVASQQSSGVPGDRRPQLLRRALCDMCRRMDKYDDSVWSHSLGKNISHVNGPLATLNRIGITKKSKPGASGLRLGRSKCKRTLCSGVPATTKVDRKLKKIIGLASMVNVTAPRTCAEWVAEHQKADALFQKARMYPAKSYMRNFIIRGLLLAAMSRSGVQRLRGAGRMKVCDFMTAFPDQSHWLRRLSLTRDGSLAALFASLNYDGRPELFSMFACLLLCKAMRVSPAWLKANTRKLRMAMCSLRSQGLLYRLPTLCVQDVV